MTDRKDALSLSGGLLAAATLDLLISKGIITVSDARTVCKSAQLALGSDIRTPEGADAASIITGMLATKYSERDTRK